MFNYLDGTLKPHQSQLRHSKANLVSKCQGVNYQHCNSTELCVCVDSLVHMTLFTVGISRDNYRHFVSSGSNLNLNYIYGDVKSSGIVTTILILTTNTSRLMHVFQESHVYGKTQLVYKRVHVHYSTYLGQKCAHAQLCEYVWTQGQSIMVIQHVFIKTSVSC